jgi:ribonuclease-3
MSWESSIQNNENNYVVCTEDIEFMVRKYMVCDRNKPEYICDFRVNDIQMYIRAFSQKSYVREQKMLISSGVVETPNDFFDGHTNERLEFLGDSILNTFVTTYLFERFPEEQEGRLTVLRSRAVNKTRLKELAKFLNFDKFLLISSHLESLRNKGQSRNNPSLLEDAFEAFIGAMYKDNKSTLGRAKTLDIIFSFLHGLFEDAIDFTTLYTFNDNYKDSMLRYFTDRKYAKPEFIEAYRKGNANNCQFCILVLVCADLGNMHAKIKENHGKNMNLLPRFSDGADLSKVYARMQTGNKVIGGMGIEKTKKLAEQKAAMLLLTNMGIPLNY